MQARNRLRLIVLTLLILLASGALSARLYTLQIVKADQFRAQAKKQQEHQEEIPARRGAIVDRQGRELAVTLETFSLFAHPGRVENKREAADKLAPLLGIPHWKIVKKLESGKRFVYLSQFLSPEKAAEVRALELNDNPDRKAFDFEIELKRSYPNDELGVHVVGYATIDDNGIAGIEHGFDEELKGDPEVFLVLHDAFAGRTNRHPIRKPQKKPLDVVLTLDATLQHIVESELESAMADTGAQAATAVLLDPATGHILAMANRPAANPNYYGKSSDAERANRATSHYYEPGSTFKIVSMAAALELGAIRLNERIFCENGLFRHGRRPIHDTSPHGILTPPQIMAKSSNIGMVKLTEHLDPDRFREIISRFGFGVRTGIELAGESPGKLSDVPQWSSFTQASLSFGQEIGVTALQMTSAFAVLANDGVLVPPRVVLGTRDSEGTIRPYATDPSRRVVSDRTAQHLRFMLEGVVDSGTGRRAQIPGYRIAGKSGTAQMASDGGYSDHAYMASFGGFAPVEAPRLAALVLIDSPKGQRHQGGQVAAPVFGRIMMRALHHLRVPPSRDDSHRIARFEPVPEPAPAPRVPSSPPGVVPDVRGLRLRDAVTALAGHGYRVQTEGRGIVSTQLPAAGARLDSGELCRLVLTPDKRRSSS